ncbi:uncharacterized protein LOC141626691 [Silene latifolia]|uniref:uncharacterized protein LOC141626691 n=1 Tax=Silene latifolia TaxID=37657 RepID=UPI003D78A027
METCSSKNGDSDIGCITNDIMKMDLSSILMHCSTDYKEDLVCYYIAEVRDIISEKPWHYPSCIKCTTRSQYKNSKFYCNNCEKIMETQTIKYRIELQVQESDSTATFVIFDKDAKRLIGQDAATLSDAQQLEKEDDEDYIPLPTLMKNTFIGKQFQFKIKVVKTNHGNQGDNCFNVINILDDTTVEVANLTAKSTISGKRAHSVIDLEQTHKKRSKPLRDATQQ